MKAPYQIYSEIAPLEAVILKRPGKEINHLVPTMQDYLLFDDLPYLPQMQKEHDAFSEVLRQNGVQVLYLDQLLLEAVEASGEKEAFIARLLTESGALAPSVEKKLLDHLLGLEPAAMLETVMAGIPADKAAFLSAAEKENLGLFLLQPMPNLYFTRDIGSVLGKGLVVHNMMFRARRRETFFMQWIASYHPLYQIDDSQLWLNRGENFHTEGGDFIVLSEEVLAVGISQRTNLAGVKAIAEKLLLKGSSFHTVLGIEIPPVRAMMHLDTVFTMVNYNAFTIHADIQTKEGKLPIHVFRNDGGKVVEEPADDLASVLKQALHQDEIILIPCGGGNPIDGPREQWNDGSNTLAIAPGKVITYDRNRVTNRLLREKGIEVFEIPSSELSRGRGGPRCMSLPLRRRV